MCIGRQKSVTDSLRITSCAQQMNGMFYALDVYRIILSIAEPHVVTSVPLGIGFVIVFKLEYSSSRFRSTRARISESCSRTLKNATIVNNNLTFCEPWVRDNFLAT
jgi:hypothetical protein